ncbi:VOC family protein [Ilumatobacter sp.]|uniref:VOC family protein n=1 Tax=Ilumatobacter sp. TaxID=1967498 RepID=UPI003B518B1A
MTGAPHSERRTFFQQAHFVPDIAEGVERWVRAVGAGPFFLAPHHRCDWFVYRGRPIEADVSYAFGYAGDMQIQLIEQHDSTPSIYLDMFEPGVGGFHHVGLLVDDFDDERDRLVDEGYMPACELRANGARASYFDTRRAIGCFTEIHDTPEQILSTFETWRAAHRDWDGHSEPLRDRPEPTPPG